MSFVQTEVETGAVPTTSLHGIGEAARLTGTSVRALRYYQEMGLVRPAALSPGGHRLYGEPELARVLRIRELQDLMGFNLAEIGELLGSEDRLDSLREAYHRDEDPERRLRIATEARTVLEELDARVEAKQRRLEDFRSAATDGELKTLFDRHLGETRQQIGRLEEVCRLLGETVGSDRNAAARGVGKQAKIAAAMGGDDATRDASLILSAQCAEHLEIAVYGSLKTWAHILGLHEAATILERTLEEERAFDKLLTDLAESAINVHAAH